jgi:hypothetical protein
MITKEQAIDILDKFDFFQGQRAGRELWNDKPFEVQEQDIKNFSNDVALLKEYISYVVPKSEVNRLYYNLQAVLEERAETRAEVARAIFEEFESIISPMLGLEDDKEYVAILTTEFAELKKKYTEVGE